MPKPLLHALIWLHEHSAFAFLGQAGRISVLKEARRGATGYWYAYRTHHRHTHKRYLGRTAQVTLARLEEEARMLSSKLSPPRLPLSLEALDDEPIRFSTRSGRCAENSSSCWMTISTGEARMSNTRSIFKRSIAIWFFGYLEFSASYALARSL